VSPRGAAAASVRDVAHASASLAVRGQVASTNVMPIHRTHPDAAASHSGLTPPILAGWLSAFRDGFTAPVWARVLVLVAGAVLAPGKRTVSQALRVMGLASKPGFGRYHEVLSRARWDSRIVARTLLAQVLDAFLPAGEVVLGVDDTITSIPQRPRRCSGDPPLAFHRLRRRNLFGQLRPVAQRLPVHTVLRCRVTARLAFQDASQRQEPANLRRVLTFARKQAKSTRRMIRPRDRQRPAHHSLPDPNRNAQQSNQNVRPLGIPPPSQESRSKRIDITAPSIQRSLQFRGIEAGPRALTDTS